MGRWWRIVLVALAAGVFAAPAQATGADPSATQPTATDPATSTTAPADSSTTPSSTATTAPADPGPSSTPDPSGSTAPAGSTSTTPADSGSTQPTTTDTTSSSTAPTGTDSSTGSNTGSTDPASPPPSSSTDTTQAPTDSTASSSQPTTDASQAPPATDATTPAPAANPAPAPTPESTPPAESTATIAFSPGIQVAAQGPGPEVRDVNRQLAPFSWFLPPGQLADALRAIPPGRLTAAQLLRPELAHLLLRRALILPLLELRGTRAWLLTDASSPLALARSAAKRAADADAQSSSRAGGGTSPLPQFPPHFPPQPDAPSGLISSAGGSATTFAFGAFAILLAAFSLVAPRRRWVVRFGTNSLHSLAIVSLPERPG